MVMQVPRHKLWGPQDKGRKLLSAAGCLGAMEFLGPRPLVICLDYVCDTGVIELQTLAIYGHFYPQALDQAVTKDAYMAVGFFQRGVANFQLER